MSKLVIKVINENDDAKTYRVKRKTLATWLEQLAASSKLADGDLRLFLNTVLEGSYIDIDLEEREY